MTESRLYVCYASPLVTMDDASAGKCAHFLKQAKEEAFNTLKEKVKDDEWLADFLKAGGLEVVNEIKTNLYHFVQIP